jgi:choline dehydrogenase-like flavoprotein
MNEIQSARDLQGDLELSADTVVVGSGAGGAVVATERALRGDRVVVLEEGPSVSAALLGKMRPSESIRHVWRDGAFTVAIGLGDSPSINVTMGRCVGGSSVLTGAVCFRTPEHVLHHWTETLRLRDYTAAAMEPYFEHVERAIHVEEVPEEMRSRSTQLFALGARRTGLEMKPMRRNTRGCDGCGRCNFGCPHQAKMSVDLSYLPRALAAGAEVWSHCLVHRVLRKGDRAVGVEGRLLGRQGRPAGRLTVHARRVVIAAGAWHTPLLLRNSGLGNPERVGHHMTLHPGFRVLARFDEPVQGWQGALQSGWVGDLEADGITLTGLFVPPGVLGATMPGVGPEHTDNARYIGHLAMFGGILHDEGGGSLYRVPGREPLAFYRMSRRDRARIPKLIRAMARAFFAAGTREVFLPVLGLRGMSADAFARFDLERIPSNRIECASQHPLGSAQMGASPEHSVVDGDGRLWGMEHLYVADGSVVPTSLGVNPQLSIMAIATRIADRMRLPPAGRPAHGKRKTPAPEMKKLRMMTAREELTTARVVAQPTPSLPPKVERPQ